MEIYHHSCEIKRVYFSRHGKEKKIASAPFVHILTLQISLIKLLVEWTFWRQRKYVAWLYYLVFQEISLIWDPSSVTSDQIASSGDIGLAHTSKL